MLSSFTKPVKEKQANPADVNCRKPWWIFAIKVAVWQILAILVVEFCLSLAGLGEEEIFKLDPALGFKHLTDKKVTWHSEGLATSYFNADGLREHGLTVLKPPGTFRIALLGDSMAESLQVPVEKSFGYQIQESIKHKLSRPVQVINFGVSGYSTVQEYLQLKQQVLKYKPDLVLLCYNSRDCFENWSPPDEVLTNVRPVALQLPGRPLVIDSSPVAQWMKSPRANFLKRVEFLRQNSRIWGLFAAAELDWSLHNNGYKKFLLLITKPGKAIRATLSELSQGWQETYNGLVKGASKTPATPALAARIESSASKSAPANKANVSTANNATSKSDSKETGKSNYLRLITNTLASLLSEMNKTSNDSGARFAVVIMPVRSALSVRPGMETRFDGNDFNGEAKMLQILCRDKGFALFNIHEKARPLSDQEKDSLFYLVHLTPKGQDFVADQLEPGIEDYVIQAQKKPSGQN